MQSRLGKRSVISSLPAIFFFCDRAMKSRLSLRCLTAVKNELSTRPVLCLFQDSSLPKLGGASLGQSSLRPAGHNRMAQHHHTSDPEVQP